MRSHIFLRAGLVALTLALCAIFTTAVPVPNSNSLSCATHPQPCLIARDLALSERSELTGIDDIDARSFSPSEHLSIRDDVDNPVTLVRRKSIFTKIKDGFKKIGKGIKNVAKKIGNGIKTAAKKVASGVKTAAKKVGEGVKTAAKKVGQGVKTAAKKVGKFVKENGAKIAKFGLKVVSTVQSVASKAAKFIPVIGKPVSAALSAASAGTNAASNAIHANLGKKLEKGMKVMDKVRNPVSGAAGAVLGALRRDLDDSELELLSRGWDVEDVLELRGGSTSKPVKFIPGVGSAIKAGIKSGVKTAQKRDLEDYELKLLSRGWDSEDLVERDDEFEFEARDEVDLDARDESHEWEAREWNEWEERDWEQWDARELEE